MNSLRWLIDQLRSASGSRPRMIFLIAFGMLMFLAFGKLTATKYEPTHPEPGPEPVVEAPLTGKNLRALRLCQKIETLADCDYTYRGRIICREPPSIAYILETPDTCKIDADLHSRIMARFGPMPRSIDPLDAPRHLPTPGEPSSRGNGG